MTTMNHWGQQALVHWRRYRPEELAEIEDPGRFFTELGQQIAAEIERRRNDTEHRSEAGQSLDFMANFQSLNAVSTTVTDDVMREMVYSHEESTPA